MAPEDRQPDGGPATPAELEQVQTLVSALLDGWMGDDDHETLERLVVRHRDAAQQYLRSVHLNCVLQLQLGITTPELTTADSGALTGDVGSPAVGELHETMVLPALRDGAGADAPVIPASVNPGVSLPIQPAVRPRRWTGRTWAAAALVVGGLALTWAVRSRRPPAMLTATAAALTSDGSPLVPKTPLVAGQSLNVTSGAVELTFNSGAVLVARAPAVLRVIDGNAVSLTSGTATAHVPTPAIGFRVDAPGLSVVDRGTDFGVRVIDPAAGAGSDLEPTTVVDVLAGRVDATVIGSDGAQGRTVHVQAGHAIGHVQGSADPLPAPLPFAAEGFDLHIATIRIAVPTYGTGVGVAPGAADPHWRVTPPSATPASAAVPAVVVENPLPDYSSNTPDVRWISTVARARDAAGGRYVYHTTVDLTGFNPATVSASASAAADDGVSGIRVNGVLAGTFAGSSTGKSWWSERRACSISGPWHDGVNQVDVLVDNASGTGFTTSPNFTGLQCALELTAVPVVRR
jgi:hypothetical protein